MYGNTSVLIMGEAKRRKNLGIPHIEKRCILKFEKDFKNNLEKSYEEWNQILDLADNNYLKCMGINQF